MADTPQAGTTSSIEDQIRLREQKAQMLREKGAHPYGNGVAVSHTTGFVRIRHAERLIAAGKPLAEVSAETGFSSQSHLTRHFKRLIGVTPGQYAR